jgi:hypothetical protein
LSLPKGLRMTLRDLSTEKTNQAQIFVHEKLEKNKRSSYLSLLHCARLHIKDLPNMAVQILKAMGVHEAMVLRFVVSRAAGRDGFTNHFIDFRPVFAG